MNHLPISLSRLVKELSRLPSVGEKTATRLAYHLVNGHRTLAVSIADAMRDAAANVSLCEQCFHLSEGKRCSICLNTARDHALLCVVEKPMDLIALERIGEYRGYYHVLHGLWAPLRGQGPENIRLQELVVRLKQGGIKEVILGIGATIEGDATALYLGRMINELGIKATRLAQGIPKGGDLEYADEMTLSRALAGRGLI